MSRPTVVVADELGERYDLASLTRELIARIPADAIAGLSSIVYREAGSLPRRDRKRSTRSQGRKTVLRSALGFYQPGNTSDPPYIEIYPDNLMRCLPAGLRKIHAVRELTIAHVLFHEIGHHIHWTKRPKYADVEQEAEHWRRHLSAITFDAQCWRKRRAVFPFIFVAAVSPGVVNLWGLEFIEKHYYWAFFLMPVLAPYALYLMVRRLLVYIARS